MLWDHSSREQGARSPPRPAWFPLHLHIFIVREERMTSEGLAHVLNFWPNSMSGSYIPQQILPATPLAA